HHRIPSQHILDPDLAQLAGELDTAAQQLEHGRQRAHGDVALAAGRTDLGTQHARRRGDRDDHLVWRRAVEDPPDLVRRSKRPDPDRVHTALAWAVVHEADRTGA